MVVEPRGSMSICKEAVRQLLAACPSWQTLCAADTAAEALTRIYLDGLPAPEDISAGYTAEEWQAILPHAVVFTRSFGLVQQAEPGWSPSAHGVIGLRIWRLVDEADVIDAEPSSDADSEWSNIIGSIMDEMSARSGSDDGTNSYLAFSEINCPDGFYCARREENALMGVVQGVDLFLGFGPGR